MPLLIRVVPSIGSTATSTSGPAPVQSPPGSPVGSGLGAVDAGAGAVEPALAHRGQLLAALPQRERLLEGGAARLQLLDDRDEFGAGLLVAEFRGTHDVATLAASSPSASRRRNASPSATSAGARTTAPSSARCTMAYPRRSVAAGDSARNRARVCARSLSARSSRWRTQRAARSA